MSQKNEMYYHYLNLLKAEVVPAMGCTEPIAIAYAAAKAREILGKRPERAAISCSFNIIKNVKSVVVPNTEGLKGIPAAVVAGLVAGISEKKLEVISEVSDSQKVEMRKELAELPLSITPYTKGTTFEIEIELQAQEDIVKLNISQFHTNIVRIEKNGQILFELDNEPNELDPLKSDEEKVYLTVQSILDFANSVELSDIIPIFQDEIKANMAIAEEGLQHNYGANIGKTWLKNNDNSVWNRAIAKAAAGSDARMSGCEMPVFINSGSGNQGLTVSVPVIEFSHELKVSEEKLMRALVVSNLIAIHEKMGIGRLSAYCGVVSAGSAATSAIAYLQGASVKDISQILTNTLAITSGIVCDGAKPSCAAKIATSLAAGKLAMNMHQNEQKFESGDGIVGTDVENTIENVSQLGRLGMKETDHEIIKIMLNTK